jgi:hypothetical protein
LSNFTKNLFYRREEAAERPKSEFVPKTLSDLVVESEGGKWQSSKTSPTKCFHVNSVNTFWWTRISFKYCYEKQNSSIFMVFSFLYSSAPKT